MFSTIKEWDYVSINYMSFAMIGRTNEYTDPLSLDGT